MPMPSPSKRPGMGAIPYRAGPRSASGRPHADAVFVTGTFDDWAMDATPLGRDGDGTHRHLVRGRQGRRGRRRVPVHDPDARRRPVAHRPLRAPGHDLGRERRRLRQRRLRLGRRRVPQPGWDDLVIYELHVGTFAGTADKRGTFDAARQAAAVPRASSACRRVQVMPPFEFAGDISWGYNPAHLFAIESSLRRPGRVQAVHPRRPRARASRSSSTSSTTTSARPTSTCGGSTAGREGDGGGIYFYNDERARTPWGMTRPDYGRGEVRTFLRDSALTWLEEFRCDGLRFDATRAHPDDRRRRARPRSPTAGRSWPGSTTRSRERQPWKLTIAEDHQSDPAITSPTAEGGAGFGAQWDVGVPPPRPRRRSSRATTRTATWASSRPRSSARVAGAPLTRVIYTESHDDVANGQVRVPESITPGAADSWWAKKRAVLGSVLVLTVARHPDAVPGPGAARGPLVRRHGRARLGEGALERRHPAAPSRRDRAPADARPGRATRGLRGTNLHILRADNESKIARLSPLGRGRPARRHGGRRQLRGPDDRRPRGSACPRRAAGGSASTPTARSTRPSSAPTRRSTSTPTAARWTAAPRAASCRSGPYSVVVLSRED